MNTPSAPTKDWRNESKGERVIREFGQVSGDRGVWESHWQEIAERIWPGMSWKFSPYWYSTPGARKTEFVLDSTASLALDRFGAILDSLLTPRNQTWHSLAPSDASLAKKRDVKLYFEEATRTLFHYRYLAQANFASQNQMVYGSLGAFGSGCLFTDQFARGKIKGKGLRYRAIGLGEIYFVENHQGIVDKAFRHFEMTARQAIQRWGTKVPEAITRAVDVNPETKFQFIHLVEPNEEQDISRADFRGKRYYSIYVAKEGAHELEEGGFNTFPYSISRYTQYPGEVYGRSIAMNLLPAIKTLNEEKKTMLKQGHRALDPVLLAHDDGVLDGFSLRPGAVNMGGVSSDGRALVHALPTGNVQIGKEMMDDERQLINDGFLITLFQILTENPQQTATEVLERAKEKGILLAPAIGRLQSEHLGSTIEVELDNLSQQGLLPPMPASLREAQGEFKIVYDSPLSRAQRAEEASGLMRTVQSALEVVNVTRDPAPLDHFDWDKIIPAISEIQGVPLGWMRDLNTIQQIRAQRGKQQQLEQASNAAPGAAAMINAGAKAHTATKGQP